MPNEVRIGFDAEAMRHALRQHHPAYDGATGMQWTTTTEWCGIDLLAVECWRQARVIGYEVKVSRGDYAAELSNPMKRMNAVSRCTQFYFAVPAGLLTNEEVEFEEPDWSLTDFERELCTNSICRGRHYVHTRGFMRKAPKPRGSTLRGTEREGATISFDTERVSGVDEHGATFSHTFTPVACCTTCKGYGRLGKSRVEQEAPMLWVPKDVGLVEVSTRGVAVIKRAPTNKTPKTILGGSAEPDVERNRRARHGIAQMMRWVSVRPDPRHHGR